MFHCDDNLNAFLLQSVSPETRYKHSEAESFPFEKKKATNNNPPLHAITTHNLHALRALLDAQDRQLFSQAALSGSPKTAAYLLSRHPPPKEEFTQYLATLHPTLNPTHYLARESARNANTRLFRYLLDQYPSLLSTFDNDPRNVERSLVNAIDGGVSIWEIILEHDARWMDHEFTGHHGCVLEFVVESGKKDLLEMLLKKGADTLRVGDPVLELARARGAGKDMLELIMKYPQEMKCW